MHESSEGANTLIGALFSNEICALLVQNLERLDETVKEESEGVHKSLGMCGSEQRSRCIFFFWFVNSMDDGFRVFAAIFENLIEFVPDKVNDIGKQGLLAWLLKRLKSKMPFDVNKLYVSEILSILLQQSKENRESFGEMEGVDVILQQLAVSITILVKISNIVQMLKMLWKPGDSLNTTRVR